MHGDYLTAGILQRTVGVERSMSSTGEGEISETVNILTECLICHKAITEATWLPCVHVFCSSCLGNDQLDSTVSCPMCGRVFPVSELRVDYFVQDLIDGFRSINDSGKSFCEFCENDDEMTEEKSRAEEEERETESGTSATKHCLDCRRNLCDDCCRGHRKHCKGHVIVDVEDTQLRRRSVSESVPRCRQHPEEKLKIYCCDCRQVACVVCYAERHHRHNINDVISASNDLQRQLKEECQWIDACASGLSSTVSDLEEQWNAYEDSVKDARLKIRDKGELLKRIIDAHTVSLNKELETITENTFSEFRQKKNTVEEMIGDLNYIKRYSVVLAENGSPLHLVNSFHRLVARAGEVKTKRAEMSRTVFMKPEIVFATPDPVERITGETKKVIGYVTLTQDPGEEKENDREAFTELLTTLSTDGRGVTGVTVLNDKLYVTCAWSNSILVNDAECPFAKHPSILVKSMSCPNDVASCTDNCCIYVVDSDNSCIWRVTPSGQSDLWLAKTSQPWTISVNCGRVLVAADGKPPHLNIYGPGAGILQRVRLPAVILSIQHAIELPNGHFVVGYGKESSGASKICEISKNGNIIRSFDGESDSKSTGASTPLLKWPKHLAFDGQDRVLVAEVSNHYVLVLNRHFQLERVLLSWDQDRVDAPSRVCYVPGTGRLLLGEATSVRVYSVHGLRSQPSPRVASKRLSLFSASKK